MSNIDLNNPQVLRNFVQAQIREGKGKIVKKTDVTVFQGDDGSQWIVPGDMIPQPAEVVETPVEKPVKGAKKGKAKKSL